MKNRIINFILILGLMLFPIFIDAITYDDIEGIANKYIKDFSKYESYIITNTTDNIYYRNANGKFVHGGLLNTEEYLRTKNGNNSYLFTGTRYLIYEPTDGTEMNKKIRIVTDKGEVKSIDLNKSPNIGVRVTEYVKSDVYVTGLGTYSEPWVFNQINSVVFSANEHGKIYKPNAAGECKSEGYKTDKIEVNANGGIAKICLAPNSGYEYVNNSCDGTISAGNSLIARPERDINCKINFGYKTYEFKLSQNDVTQNSDPRVIYLVHGKGWYSNKSGTTSIKKLNKIPKRYGYNFNGYKYDGYTIIDNNGNLNSTAEVINHFNSSPIGEIDIAWTPKEYTITYNNDGSTTTKKVTYGGELPTVSTKPTKSGLRFNGYVDDKNNVYYDKDLNKKIDKWTLDNDITLTAKWTDGSIKYEDIATSFKCSDIQVGDEPYLINYTGRCKLVDDGAGNWRLKLLSSGTLVLADKLNVDLFLVGGGGGGGNGSGAYGTHTGGGGGGYTKTERNLTLNPQSYTVQVGNGGAVGADGQESYFMIDSSKKSVGGGKTPSSSIPGLLHCGRCATCMKDGQSIGGNGGSGGGSGASGAVGTTSGINQCQNNINANDSYGGRGGSDGSRGEIVGNHAESSWNCKAFYSPVVSSGQGSTTREFGESSGTLYSGGGGGKHGECSIRPPQSPAGVGGAGGGGTEYHRQTVDKRNGEENTGGGGAYKGKGGSGIVIIRNKR